MLIIKHSRYNDWNFLYFFICTRNCISISKWIQQEISRKCSYCGRIFCGKAYFVQKLATNNFFVILKKVEWISYIQLD